MNTDEQYFETVIIGTGFSGLLAAIRLKKKGADDFVLLERESEIGGTWQNNSYPGAEVDIPTGLYSFSFTNYKFKKRYAPQSELLEYTNDIIDQFDLRKSSRANQEVTKVTYDEVGYLWHVEVGSGERYTSRFIIDTSGVLANPHTPYIQGAESFQGDVFHTAEWDHNVSYEGKNVGVIGSGCSATQVVPAIAEQVNKLTVFMGTPEWILPRSDRSYSPIEQTFMNLPGIRQLNRFIIFLVHELRFIGFRRYPFTIKLSGFIKYFYKLSLQNNLKKYIRDDKVREYMMPDYELGCRRVIPSNAYLPALSRENVQVDISGIETITPSGICTKGGQDIPLDIIVYATGYFAYSNVKKMLSFQVYGREGRHLNSEWEAGAVSYKGITVSGFPNYFKINGPNTGTGHSSQISYMETMVNYAVDAISAIKQDKSLKAIDVKSDVQRAYMMKVKDTMKSTVWQNGSCKSFYRSDKTGEVTSLSPESMVHFIFSRKWFHLIDYQLFQGEIGSEDLVSE
jgi:cation diffusion facilitator CzcD-associated flavoprotein CzcO